MIDALHLLSPRINKKFSDIALENGRPTRGYERCVDLREQEPKLPARLYFNGRHTPVHKLELIGVARLGLPLTQQIVETVFPDLKRVTIYRIDCCVDLLGKNVWHFAESCHIPRVQNYRLFRNRGAVSIYLQASKNRTVVFYDKGRERQAKKSPMAAILMPGDSLTRFEMRFQGSGVPVRDFLRIEAYAEMDFVANIRFARLRVPSNKSTPMELLKAEGVRALVRRYGQQMAFKSFPPAEAAYLKKKFLKPSDGAEAVELNRRIRKSVADWMAGRIRYPRFARKS